MEQESRHEYGSLAHQVSHYIDLLYAFLLFFLLVNVACLPYS